jgi:hypothetical protein
MFLFAGFSPFNSFLAVIFNLDFSLCPDHCTQGLSTGTSTSLLSALSACLALGSSGFEIPEIPDFEEEGGLVLPLFQQSRILFVLLSVLVTEADS